MTPTLLAFLDDVEHGRIPADEVRHRARLARHEVERLSAPASEPTVKISNRVDVVTLQHLAQQLQKDAKDFEWGLNKGAMLSVADIINTAIGAPLMTDISSDAAEAADTIFPGNPSSRHAFNWGAAWAVSRLANCRTFRFGRGEQS